MQPSKFAHTYPAAVANGLATSQTPAAAGYLTLTATAAALSAPAYVTIASGSNESGKNFTITGVDPSGNAQVVTIAGPNAGTATTTQAWSSVSSIYVSAATAGAITVGFTQSGYSKMVPLDYLMAPFSTNIRVTISGTVNCTIQHTFDNVFDTTVTPTWINHASLAALTSSAEGTYVVPVRAVRLLWTSGGGTATVNVVQAGLA